MSLLEGGIADMDWLDEKLLETALNIPAISWT
jgi:hypothetical protein